MFLAATGTVAVFMKNLFKSKDMAVPNNITNVRKREQAIEGPDQNYSNQQNTLPDNL